MLFKIPQSDNGSLCPSTGWKTKFCDKGTRLKPIVFNNKFIYPALLFLSALVLRVIIYNHTAPALFPDSQEYIKLSEALRKFDFSPFYRRPPGYPLFLSIIFTASGEDNYRAVVTVQLLISTFVPLLLYFILSPLARLRILAFLCALFSAFNLSLLGYDTLILTESLSIFLVAVAIFLIIRGLLSNSITPIIFASVTLALLSLVRPLFSALFIIVASVTFIWRQATVKKNNTSQPKLKSFLLHPSFIIFLLPLLLIGGWAFRNKLSYGIWGVSSSMGLNLTNLTGSFIEIAPAKTAPEKLLQEIYLQRRERESNHFMLIWKLLPEIRERTGLSEPEISRHYFNLSLRAIVRRPAEYLTNVALGWCSFWAGRQPMYGSPQYLMYLAQHPLLKSIFFFYEISLLGSYFIHKYLTAIFITSLLILGYWHRNNAHALLVVFLITSVVFYTALLSSLIELGETPRYRAPVEPLILGTILLCILQIILGTINYVIQKLKKTKTNEIV
ncbi:MAG: hypothetical protein N2246_04130 [Candidatus Sumerlaeia bacterium]|nr:hypothetical protein [Candidatus Sumerlaeia bacterium]